MKKKDKLVICDLDGTLFDTRRVNFTSYTKALEKAGIPVTFDYKTYLQKYWGPTYRYFLPQMGVPQERVEEVHDLKKDFYQESIGTAVENTHLFNIIEALRPAYYTAVVTSGSRNAKEILDRFGRTELFDLILTIDDVENGKPDPEGFLRAMEHFGVEPEQTLIFEDSKAGVTAARACGASVCIVDDFALEHDVV